MADRRIHSLFQIQKRGIKVLTVVGVLAACTILVADEVKKLEPSPVFFHVSDKMVNAYTSDKNTSEFVRKHKIAIEHFHAVESTEWPNGLAPIFVFFAQGEFRLSRTPKTGWENLMDPEFFALPPANETNAAALNGGWFVSATNSDGHTDQFSWELTTDGSQVAGRFDPNTDYRFATISGGVWESTQLKLKVDYINDHYELTGGLTGNKFSGTWKKLGDFDGGGWTARRRSKEPIINTEGFNAVPLYEWKHPSTGKRSYSTDQSQADQNLIRTENPICRVWMRTTPSPEETPSD